MDIQTCVKESFAVIGKEGSTNNGEGFIQRLWDDANNHFNEIESLVKRDDNNNPVGIWGAMSDFSRSFKPWEGFTEGLYLAGAEVNNDAQAPEGWTKWIVPSYEYLYVKIENENTFSSMIMYMEENSLKLAGAVNDYISLDGQTYMYFPIRRL